MGANCAFQHKLLVWITATLFLSLLFIIIFLQNLDWKERSERRIFEIKSKKLELCRILILHIFDIKEKKTKFVRSDVNPGVPLQLHFQAVSSQWSSPGLTCEQSPLQFPSYVRSATLLTAMKKSSSDWSDARVLRWSRDREWTLRFACASKGRGDWYFTQKPF